MKRFWQWLLGIVSRKIAADYASGKNGWDKAIMKRQVFDSTKRLMTSSSSS
jgi:hypothetical protein